MSESSTSAARASELLGNMQIGDYWGIARRRKWHLLLTTIVVFVATAVFVRRMPDVFVAETVILVDPQQVPAKYVNAIVSDIGDRLSTLQPQVLSPSRLKRLIDSMNLYPELRERRSEQEIIAMMQQAITVEVVKPGRAGKLSAFRIAFRGKDPAVVAAVTNRLAQMFIEENLKVREEQSEGTAEFLESELASTKKDLDQKDNLLRQIKSTNILDLPESKAYHMEALATLRNQLQTSQDRAAAAQQQKSTLLQYLRSAQQDAPRNSATGMESLMHSSAQSPYEQQIQKLQLQLSELRGRYGPRHPDVLKTQHELEQLMASGAAEKARSASAPPANSATPAAETSHATALDAQVQKLDREIEEQTRSQAQKQNEINLHVSKLERMPIVEQQLAGLRRDYDILQAHYASLLDKKLSAGMANALESHQKAERFVVLDPAVPSQKPSFPNRPLFSLAGLLGGLMGGLVLALMAEFNDKSVRTESEAAGILGKPVLAGIPLIVTSRERRWKAVRAAGLLAGTAASSAALGFLLSMLGGKL